MTSNRRMGSRKSSNMFGVLEINCLYWFYKLYQVHSHEPCNDISCSVLTSFSYLKCMNVRRPLECCQWKASKHDFHLLTFPFYVKEINKNTWSWIECRLAFHLITSTGIQWLYCICTCEDTCKTIDALFWEFSFKLN